MATRRQRGRTWHYTVRRAQLLSKPIYLTFEDRDEGDAYVARLEALLDAGVVPDAFKARDGLPVTLADALVAYQRAVDVKDRDVLRVLEARYGATPLSAIDYAWLELWLDQLKRVRRLAPSRVRKFKGSLSRCLDWLVNRYPGALAVNPCHALPKGYSGGVRADVSRERRLEPGEEARLHLVLDDELLVLTVLALETAMRLRELYTLEAAQIDRARRTIFLEKTKNGDKRQVPLSSVALRVLAAVETHGHRLAAAGGTPAQITARLSRRFARAAEAARCVRPRQARRALQRFCAARRRRAACALSSPGRRVPSQWRLRSRNAPRACRRAFASARIGAYLCRDRLA